MVDILEEEEEDDAVESFSPRQTDMEHTTPSNIGLPVSLFVIALADDSFCLQ